MVANLSLSLEVYERDPEGHHHFLWSKQIFALLDTPSLCTGLPELILLLTCESLGSRGSYLTLPSILAAEAPQLVFSTW